jgi:PAB1-binding protein PBP1
MMNNMKQTNTNNIEDNNSLSERGDEAQVRNERSCPQSSGSDPITLNLQKEYDKTTKELNDCFKNNVTGDDLIEVLVRDRKNTEKLMNRYCDLLGMDRLYPDV